MLPNHSPLVIAEQFGTLAALFPGRIDLGLGRAPGSDGITAQGPAARSCFGRTRSRKTCSNCSITFEPAQPGQMVQRRTGGWARCPALDPGIEPVRGSTRGRPRPSVRFRVAFRAGTDAPGDRDLQAAVPPLGSARAGRYVMLGPQRLRRRHRCRGAPALHLGRAAVHQPAAWDAGQAAAAHRGSGAPLGSARRLSSSARALSASVVGSPETVRQGLESFILAHRPDELMIAGANLCDHDGAAALVRDPGRRRRRDGAQAMTETCGRPPERGGRASAVRRSAARTTFRNISTTLIT